jgi:hypothetical protein
MTTRERIADRRFGCIFPGRSSTGLGRRFSAGAEARPAQTFLDRSRLALIAKR